MKKLIAILSALIIPLSTSTTVAYTATRATNNKNITHSVENAIYASSFSAKASVLYTEKGLSANSLLTTWKRESVEKHLGSGIVADLTGTNATVENYLTSTFGDENNWLLQNKNGTENFIKKTNIPNNTSNPITADSSTLTIVNLVTSLLDIILGMGLGASSSSLLEGLLKELGGLDSDGGILDQMDSAIQNNQSLFYAIKNSLSWESFVEFGTRANGSINRQGVYIPPNISFNDPSTITLDVIEMSHKYLADALNDTIYIEKEDGSQINNVKSDTNGTIIGGNGKTKQGNSNLSNTIYWLISNLFSEGKMNSIKFNSNNTNQLIISVINWLKITLIYSSQYFDVLNFNGKDSNHIFSNSKTNKEYKTEIFETSFWNLPAVINNSLELGTIFNLLKKLFIADENDTNGYSIQKFMYIFLGDYQVNGNDVSFSNNISFFHQIFYGIYDSLVPLVINLDLIDKSNSLVNIIINIVSGYSTSDIAYPSTIITIPLFAGVAGISRILRGLESIFEGLLKSLAENNLYYLFNGIGELFEGLFINNTYLGDNLWNNVKGLISNDSTTQDLYEKSLRNSIPILQDINSDFNKNYENFLGALQTGTGDRSLFGVIRKSFKELDPSGNLSNIIEPVLDSIGSIAIFEQIKNLSDLGNLSINSFLGIFGTQISDSSKILFTIGDIKLSSLISELNNVFEDEYTSIKISLKQWQFLLQTMVNPISVNGSNATTSIFRVMKNAELDTNYKNSIKTITYKGLDHNNNQLNETINIANGQTLTLSLFGIRYENNSYKLVDGGLFSGLSSVFGPSSDWKVLGAENDWIQGIDDNAKFFDSLNDLLKISSKEMTKSKNLWQEENIDKYSKPENWEYTLLEFKDNQIVTEDAFVKYKLIWINPDTLIKKTYLVNVKRNAGLNMFDTQNWYIDSIYSLPN